MRAFLIPLVPALPAWKLLPSPAYRWQRAQ